MKKKEVYSRAKAFFTIVLILLAAYGVPKMLTGFIALDQVPDIEGDWNADQTYNFEYNGCSADTDSFRFTHTWTVVQSGDKIFITSPPFKMDSSGEFITDFNFSGGFISQDKLYGDLEFYIPEGHGKVIAHMTELALGEDCNSAHATETWEFVPKSISEGKCTGRGETFLTRVNPTGCGLKCMEDWECSEWGECKDGTQTRMCFDNNYCKNESSRPSQSQECEMPVVPAPVPEKKESTWIYLIIISLILVVLTVAIILLVKIKKGKHSMVDELQDLINKMNLGVYRGDKEDAMKQYSLFTEMLERYKSHLTEEEYKKVYWGAMEAYNKMQTPSPIPAVSTA